MTQNEWLAATDPGPMLEFVGGRSSDRKLWLYATACFRRIRDGAGRAKGRHILHEPQAPDKLERAIETTERYADGEVGGEERAAAWCDWVFAQGHPPTDWGVMRAAVGGAAWHAARIGCEAWALGDNGAAALVRDLIGNPFLPVTPDPSWLTWNAVALARRIYEERAFQDLPLLADALEEAGCSDADILSHCRGPGPHVRGCWVVDLLLGKE